MRKITDFSRKLSFFLMILGFIAGCGKERSNDLKTDQLSAGDELLDDGLLPDKWEYQKKWTAEEEERYVKWIQLNYTTDFFTKRNIWADCADTEMIRRAWYSIKRSLPFGYHPIYDLNRIVSSLSYDKKKPIEFIVNMRDATSTKNLPFNSYLIKIAQNFNGNLKPGIFHLFFEQHTMPIADIDREVGLLTIRDSTLVTKPITLNDHPYFETASTDRSNLRHQFIPVVNQEGKMSLELLDPGLQQVGPYNVDLQKKPFFEWLQQLILGLNEQSMGTIRERTVKKLAENFQAAIVSRIPVVNEGYNICKDYVGTDALLCAAGHEGTHSTPSRDSRLTSLYRTLQDYQKMLTSLGLSNLSKWVDDYLTANKISFRVNLKPKNIPLEFQRTVNLDSLTWRIFTGLISADPKDPVQERWGDNIRNLYSPNPEKDYNSLITLHQAALEVCYSLTNRNGIVYNTMNVCYNQPFSRTCRQWLQYLKDQDQQYANLIRNYLNRKVDVSPDLRVDADFQKMLYLYPFKLVSEKGIDKNKYQKDIMNYCFISYDPYKEDINLPIAPHSEGNLISSLEFYNSYSQNQISYNGRSSWYEFWGRRPSWQREKEQTLALEKSFENNLTTETQDTKPIFSEQCRERLSSIDLETVTSLDELFEIVKDNQDMNEVISFENYTVQKDGRYYIYHLEPIKTNSAIIYPKAYNTQVFVQEDPEGEAVLDQDLGKDGAIPEVLASDLIKSGDPLKYERVSDFVNENNGTRISLVKVNNHVKYLSSDLISCDGLAKDWAECRCD